LNNIDDSDVGETNGDYLLNEFTLINAPVTRFGEQNTAKVGEQDLVKERERERERDESCLKEL
jgi:hypothetical protein